MQPPKRRHLTDTDEELVAIASEASAQRVLEERNESMSSTEQLERQTEAAVNRHKLDCWSDDGPLGKLRHDVVEMKSWSKGVIVAIAILGLLNAYSVFFAKHGAIPIPTFPDAHAAR